MDLLMLVFLLVIVGFVVYALTTYVPMPPRWAQAIQILAFLVLLLYLITRFLPLPNVLR